MGRTSTVVEYNLVTTMHGERHPSPVMPAMVTVAWRERRGRGGLGLLLTVITTVGLGMSWQP